MNTTNKTPALALMAVAMVFASCCKDDNEPAVPTQQEIETKIVGKWKRTMENGKPVATNRSSVLTYNSDGTSTRSYYYYDAATKKSAWYAKSPMSYTLNGNQMCEKELVNGFYTDASLYSEVLAISDKELNVLNTKRLFDGKEEVVNQNRIYTRVTKDFSKYIEGMWRGVTSTGDTYGNSDHYWLFCEDGTYSYFTKNEDGKWGTFDNILNEYTVDGDWLACHWITTDNTDNCECWNIDKIEDNRMHWSAIREQDGKQQPSTFELERVSVAPTGAVGSMLVGKWKSVVEDNEDVLTDRRSVRTYLPDGTTYISFSRKFQTLGFQWANKYLMNYQIKNDVLTVEEPISSKLYQFVLTGIGEDFADFVSLQKNGGLMKTVKVTADYSKDIIGLWEGVEMTGYETYGNVDARIEYKADGTYTYYVKSGDNWVPSTNVDNEYYVDGDWLANRWRSSAGADYNYEWWDIDNIKDGNMKWSALREKEDGTRFATTFTWKKINN